MNDLIFHILCGLEEEGIPFQMQERPQGAAALLAREAARSSSLNVGIGVDSSTYEVALHHRDLADGAPLFTLSREEYQSPVTLRRLGVNAARLVKADPLVV
jgi:hypothetical protein